MRATVGGIAALVVCAAVFAGTASAGPSATLCVKNGNGGLILSQTGACAGNETSIAVATKEGLDTASGDTQALADRVTALETAVQQLTAAVAALQDRATKIESDTSGLHDTAAGLRTDVTALQAHAAASDAADLAQKDATAAVGARVGKLEAGAATFGTSLDALTGRVTTLEGAANSLGTRLSALEANVSGFGGSLDTLTGRVGSDEGAATKLGQKVDDIASEVTLLGTGQTQLTGRVTTLERKPAPTIGEIVGDFGVVGFYNSSTGRFSCPSGFNYAGVGWDTEDSFNNDMTWDGGDQIVRETSDAPNLTMEFCIK
jgi:uncharacterized phage infection (PIP) family protein YhgE